MGRVDNLNSYLVEKTHTKSVREIHYQSSNYIAEFYCTLSNFGLFLVAYYYNDYITLIGAIFSLLSHAIPSQRLHDLDLFGVLMISLRLCWNFHIFINHIDVLFYGSIAIIINGIDLIVTRRYLKYIGSSLHVIWHLSVAFALYKFNETLSLEESRTDSII